jgi:hypothetical protein
MRGFLVCVLTFFSAFLRGFLRKEVSVFDFFIVNRLLLQMTGSFKDKMRCFLIVTVLGAEEKTPPESRYAYSALRSARG